MESYLPQVGTITMIHLAWGTHQRQPCPRVKQLSGGRKAAEMRIGRCEMRRNADRIRCIPYQMRRYLYQMRRYLYQMRRYHCEERITFPS